MPIFHRTFLLFLALAFASTSCGGGGSGDAIARTYRGTLTAADGSPLGGVLVRLEDDEDAALTDAAGRFEFESEFGKRSVRLLFESQTLEGEFEISNIPDDTVVVTVQCEANESGDDVEPKAISFEEDEE